MLQEESCKRLAKIMHRSFSKVYIREFASTVDIDLDQQMKQLEIGPDRTVRDVMNHHVQKNANQRFVDRAQAIDEEEKKVSLNPLGQGTQYMG